MVRVHEGAKKEKGERRWNKKMDNLCGLNISRSSLPLDESAEEGRFINTQTNRR